jgi:hypothetical protein
VLCGVCVVCVVCPARMWAGCGLDVGCDVMMRESGCEAVRVAGGGGGVCR